MVNCVYCKAQLPETDKTKIPNEELLANAAEWVGKSASPWILLPLPPGVTDNMLGTNQRVLRNEEICAIAERYLMILAIRAEGSPVVANQLRILESRLKENREILKRKHLLILKGIILFIIICLIAGVIGLFTQGDNNNNNINRLVEIEADLNAALRNSDLDGAEILLIKMQYTGFNRREANTWTKKHDQYRQEIDRRRKLKER
jgi:hypothetical protein